MEFQEPRPKDPKSSVQDDLPAMPPNHPLHGLQGAMRRAAIWLAAAFLAGCVPPAPEADRAGLRLGAVLGAGAKDAGFAKAELPRAFAFPADHGAHPAFRSEWWYLTAALESDGRAFGVQFTVFRQALFPEGPAEDPWRNGQAWLGHLAITDVAAGRHLQAERLARGHPALAGAQVAAAHADASSATSPNPDAALAPAKASAAQPGPAPPGAFSLWLEGWRLEGRQLTRRDGLWSLDAAAEDFSVSLRLAQTKPIVLQGDRGLSVKGPGQASYYYSIPRLRAEGQLQVDGATHAATGLAWLDREWSTSMLGEQQLGWDWFALMLDSGEDLMAFRMRRSDGRRDPWDRAARIDRTGAVRHLQPADFRLAPLGWWRDEWGAAWPVRWSLQIEQANWQIVAAIEDQRMDALLTYWEGLVEVQDEAGRRLGRGYMELTGY